MEVKLDVRNIDLRNTQEMVEDNVKLVQKTSRKVARTYAGLLGMAYDEAKAILGRGCKIVGEAEHRGEKMEAATLRQVKSASKSVTKQVKGAEREVQKVQKRLAKRVRRSEAQAENEIDAQVERVLERLGIPSRDRIVKLSAEIEALSRKIDLEVVQAGVMKGAIEAEAQQAVEQMPLPLTGYDSMTAREIVALLDGMTESQLADVKAYEMAHDNRVTITREVDRRFEANDETSDIVVA